MKFYAIRNFYDSFSLCSVCCLNHHEKLFQFLIKKKNFNFCCKIYILYSNYLIFTIIRNNPVFILKYVFLPLTKFLQYFLFGFFTRSQLCFIYKLLKFSYVHYDVVIVMLKCSVSITFFF